jgi:hypothetical protein
MSRSITIAAAGAAAAGSAGVVAVNHSPVNGIGVGVGVGSSSGNSISSVSSWTLASSPASFHNHSNHNNNNNNNSNNRNSGQQQQQQQQHTALDNMMRTGSSSSSIDNTDDIEYPQFGGGANDPININNLDLNSSSRRVVVVDAKDVLNHSLLLEQHEQQPSSSHMTMYNNNNGSSSNGDDANKTASFKTIGSVPIVLLFLLLLVANELQVCIAWLRDDVRFVAMQAALLLASSALFFLIRRLHNRLRILGYIQLYTLGNRYTRYTFFIASVSFGIVASLFVFYPDSAKQRNAQKFFTRTAALVIVISIEQLCLLCIWLKYIHMCTRHNRSGAAPDVDEELSSSYDSVDLVKRQGKLIQQLKKHRRALTEQLLRATQQNETSSSSSSRSGLLSHHTSAAAAAGGPDLLRNAQKQLRMLHVEADAARKQLAYETQRADELQESYARVKDELVAERKLCADAQATQRHQSAEIERLAQLVDIHQMTNDSIQDALVDDDDDDEHDDHDHE